MLVQILDEYKNRTEYRLLKNFYDCKAVKVNALQNGVLVLPGILLNKMNEQQLSAINEWLEDSRNQLILTPAWLEMNLKDIFNSSSVDIKISKADGRFDEVPVGYKIDTLVKNIVFRQDGKCFGIHYRKNTGVGLITVVTLPLLDYKLIQFEDKFKILFDSLLYVDKIKPEFQIEDRGLMLDDIHIYLIILSGAQVDLSQQISAKLSKYFGVTVDEKDAEEKYRELMDNKYVTHNGLTEKGLAIVKERKLKAFINAAKQRGEKEDGWD
ncbi:hypothetical protein Desca_0289 [Desulfotomaculum nigrificans CO-1-SRB]|uniref:Uncharacterized protein n=1 Tax=Desulfotomaculum nigrificans (strain DSM 14880 / VKM B-2319 / CO-1-SRB) TaxID=868595 RepID=F6B6C2_DESCC|nr:hypothetical protein [Desulfotomaculum nigrificans]AEF93193.1 hypothetical protein Desca_0289 [Desulfotomaculum nigrificans CO-1-SRB]